jgi:hypothetical protein
MVHTCTGDFTQDVPEPSNARPGAAINELRNAARGTPPPPPPPPPPVSLKQLLAMQNELMRVLTKTSYTDFPVTHPPTFAEATNPLEADNWLHVIESKFGLLHYTEY